VLLLDSLLRLLDPLLLCELEELWLDELEEDDELELLDETLDEDELLDRLELEELRLDTDELLADETLLEELLDADESELSPSVSVAAREIDAVAGKAPAPQTQAARAIVAPAGRSSRLSPLAPTTKPGISSAEAKSNPIEHEDSGSLYTLDRPFADGCYRSLGSEIHTSS